MLDTQLVSRDDRGRQDILLDPGTRDLAQDGELRDLLHDPGIQDLLRDAGVQDMLGLGLPVMGRLATIANLTICASRSGGFAVSRRRD